MSAQPRPRGICPSWWTQPPIMLFSTVRSTRRKSRFWITDGTRFRASSSDPTTPSGIARVAGSSASLHKSRN